jgi:hypothetical protein
VNFLSFRIWEEISMYNHLTNDWGEREHLAAVDPMQPAVQRVLLAFLEKWLRDHPDTKVVRFTSMFYNFSWFWGADRATLRDVYSDWADYAMTVSPRALKLFEKKSGYRLTSEDFVNGGLYNSTHNAPSRRYRDYMAFMHDFVIAFGRQCIDRVHHHGKLAYVFYDDHWVGVEPSSPRFHEFGFDGLIKCAFNAFEVRLCAHSRGVATHELRLHPYLFPTGLKGEPTFKPGGNPTLDAKNFWIAARRGLVRAPIDLGKDVDGIYVFGGATQVLAERDGSPRLATHGFGRGRSVYLSGFKFTHENTRLLHRAIFWAAAQEAGWAIWNSSNVKTEATWFAKAKKLVVINNAGEPQDTVITFADGKASKPVHVEAHGIAILDV